jgi:phosphoribosylformimino-5-aminoimidazole carboxamide ribotide isomerase
MLGGSVHGFDLQATEGRETSCRKRGDGWFVAMNKWQDITDMEVSQGMLRLLHMEQRRLTVEQSRSICSRSTAGQPYPSVSSSSSTDWLHSEFLIHAADVEGLCQGIDEALVSSAFTARVPDLLLLNVI